jgi:hypothetical protein
VIVYGYTKVVSVFVRFVPPLVNYSERVPIAQQEGLSLSLHGVCAALWVLRREIDDITR